MLLFSIFVIFLSCLCQAQNNDTAFDPDAGTCLGTTAGLAVGKDRYEHYERLFERYQNCTVVKGNLEITGLIDVTLDFSFLENIEVITGYLLISSSFIPHISMSKLRVIRGRNLFEQKWAIFVYNNINRDNPHQHLEELRFPSLTEIVQGGVYIHKNSLCFVDNILWKDLFTESFTTAGTPREVVLGNNTDSSCGVCHSSCAPICETGNATFCENDEDCSQRKCIRRCWGEGPDLCQKLNQVTCHYSCLGARCRGPRHDDCCDRECAAGCTGPTDTDCLVCLHVNDTGSCQRSCPQSPMYDPGTQSYIPNPHRRFHYSDYCVETCPGNLLVEQNGCVKTCSFGFHNNGRGQCDPCPNNACENECYGVNHHSGPLAGNKSVDSTNIHYFEGCNVVKGSLEFNTLAFGSESPISDQQLEILKSIKKITGYLHITSWSKNYTSFSAFENLEEIGGNELYQNLIALAIQDSSSSANVSFNNHISSLGFRSLKTIYHGNVFMRRLENLCYDRRVNWSRIVRHPVHHDRFDADGVFSLNNKQECNNTQCNSLCDDNGCWGPGPSECLNCRYKSYNGTCYRDCIKEMGIFAEAGKQECQSCDEECKYCIGPGPGNCTVCRHFSYDQECVKECPITHYGDPIFKECLPCNESCTFHLSKRICTGPKPIVGKGGCNFCEFALATKSLEIIRCLTNNSSCPVGYFTFNKLDGIKHTCVPCYEGCSNCTGQAASECLHALPLTGEDLALAVSIPFILIVLVAVLIVFGYRYQKKKQLKQRQRSMKELGIDVLPDEQAMDPTTRLMGPATPSGVAPNQAQLRIVKETELRIGKILGSGAFGTVHKGFWIPDSAKEKIKVPVAIKVLRDESSQKASNEILDEAFLMASCKHPYLMRLLGISLSQQIMLVTQLMPSGNLLDYVRDNKDKIGSQHLLNWSLQIAKGMCYLAEEKHLVHRDLAARNVLVKSPHHVCITDFGLAKLLDVNENAYRAEGGKMPIKWLALESIQHRIFTHKSDVWSFGVTVWELLTFGKKPYENVLARDVYALLERGERLSQPIICTIDVYMLLIKCWTVDAEARPTFSELSEELLRMAKDPPRYIVIENEGMLKELQCSTMDDLLESLNEEQGDGFVITDAEMYQRQLEEGIANGDLPSHSDSLSFSSRRNPHRSISSTSSSLNFRSSGRTSGRFNHRKDSLRSAGHLPAYDKRSDAVFTTGASATLPLQSPANNLEDIDEMQCVSRHRNGVGYRYSDNQDVFEPPTYKELSQLAESEDSCIESELQLRLNRAREDSTTLRYSADPVSSHRKHSATRRLSTSNKHFEQADFGYLTPFEAANKKPEYLDPNHPPTPSSLKSGIHPLTRSGSAVTNPEYEAAFDFRNISPNLDSEGYEIPMTPGDLAMSIEPSLNRNHSDTDSLYLLRQSSRSSISLTSGKLGSDSGMQSEEDGERRKTSVVNPNYEWCGKVPSDHNSEPTDYENLASDVTKLNFGEDEIFNSSANTNCKSFQCEVLQRTYSEPDSGVGIELAADAITYQKQLS